MARKKKARGRRAKLAKTGRLVAGVDIGSCEHFVCGPEIGDEPPEVRTFGATTSQLDELVDWLHSLGVESVAMESTYLYWIPLYEMLETAGIEAVLVNARTLKNVPGRKTDMADCQWLQLLHSCGLLRGSFRPSGEIGRLRAITRERTNYVAARARAVQHMQKALDQMNVLVHRAVSDLTGKTGLAIVRAIVQGERDPMKLAALRNHRCRRSVEEIAEYLTGTWHDEHLFNLSMALRDYDNTHAILAEFDAKMEAELVRLQPEERRDQPCPEHPNANKARAIKVRDDEDLREALWRFCGVDLTTIDGINASSAQVIVTELGLDIAKFPTEKHFVSWLRLCPRTPISGGKPLKKRRNGMGASRLASIFRIAAVAVRRSKTALGATYRRMASKKSAAQAAFIVARIIAKHVYRMLRFGKPYADVGQAAYEQRYLERRIASLHRNAKELGLAVIPAPVEAI